MNGERRLDARQQGVDVLAHVVVARAGAECFGALFVVTERPQGEVLEVGKARRVFVHGMGLAGEREADPV